MRILFVHSGNETFVEIDRTLLEAAFEVQDFHAEHKFPASFPTYLRGIRRNDLVFCWFASWNSFWALLLARIFRKPSILVVGGYDVANLPQASYGQQRAGLGKWISRFAMRSATRLLTNSFYSQREAGKNAGIRSETIRVIYHGVPDLHGSLPETPKERMALTVGNVEWSNLRRKGQEPFVRAASRLPDVRFVLVGNWKDDSIQYLRSIASSNVCFTGRISDQELTAYYRRSSVYVQASLHEGFGLSVAEAMLAGCIPVVTMAGSLPEVVGDCGCYCASTSPELIAQAIRSAFALSAAERARARERILVEFPLEKRKQALLQLIHECMAASHA